MGAHLEWERGRAASGCAAAPEIERQVEAILERPVFVDAEEADVRVRGRIVGEADGTFTVTLSAIDQSGASLGERVLHRESPDCRAMTRPVSLVLALFVDFALDVVESAPEREPGSSPWHLWVDASVTIGYGLMPGVALGPSVELGIEPAGFVPLVLTGSYWLSTEKLDATDAGGRFTAWHAGLALCPHVLGAGALDVLACGGAAVGAVHGRGVGLDVVRREREPYAHVVAGLRATVRLGPLRLLVGLEGWVPVVASNFHYEQGTDEVRVHRPLPVVPVARMSIGGEFF